MGEDQASLGGCKVFQLSEGIEQKVSMEEMEYAYSCVWINNKKHVGEKIIVGCHRMEICLDRQLFHLLLLVIPLFNLCPGTLNYSLG